MVSAGNQVYYHPLSGYPACCARCICTIHVCVQTCIFTCVGGQKVKNPSTQVSIHSVLFEKYLTGSVFLMGKGYIYVLQIKKKEGGTIPQKDSFLLCNKFMRVFTPDCPSQFPSAINFETPCTSFCC